MCKTIELEKGCDARLLLLGANGELEDCCFEMNGRSVPNELVYGLVSVEVVRQACELEFGRRGIYASEIDRDMSAEAFHEVITEVYPEPVALDDAAAPPWDEEWMWLAYSADFVLMVRIDLQYGDLECGIWPRCIVCGEVNGDHDLLCCEHEARWEAVERALDGFAKKTGDVAATVDFFGTESVDMLLAASYRECADLSVLR